MGQLNRKRHKQRYVHAPSRWDELKGVLEVDYRVVLTIVVRHLLHDFIADFAENQMNTISGIIFIFSVHYTQPVMLFGVNKDNYEPVQA